MWNAISSGFELVSPCPIPATITITPRAPIPIILIVIGAFGTVTKGLLKGLEDPEVGRREETIQTIALLRTSRIMRRVLETWGDFLLLKLQWKTISWCEKFEWMDYNKNIFIEDSLKITLLRWFWVDAIQTHTRTHTHIYIYIYI